MENIISTANIRFLTASAVDNFTNTFTHYSTAIQDELPAFTNSVKTYTLPLLVTSRTFVATNPWATASTALILYLLLVRALRFQNLRSITAKNAAYLSDPTKLDYKTAHSIYTNLLLRETPFMYGFSTQWALMKTYAMAPGTGLLVATRQLTQASTVGKRAEDTGVILGEILVAGLDSERGLKALSKMNWLHRRYGGKIRRPEMLHTLAMFVLEPIRWMEEGLEWRTMTELEQAAVYTYWREIGSRMGMADIPTTLAELKAWTAEYERDNMYYSTNNHACAEATVNLFIRDMPSFAQRFAKQAALSCMEPRVLVALGYDEPPAYIRSFVRGFFKTRAWVIRHLVLPRWKAIDALPKEKGGRLYRNLWAFEPWYVQATLWEKAKGWFWTGGKAVPGREFKSDGYLVEELGPVEYEKVSKEGVLKEAKQMQRYAEAGGAAGMGCPFKIRL